MTRRRNPIWLATDPPHAISLRFAPWARVPRGKGGQGYMDRRILQLEKFIGERRAFGGGEVDLEFEWQARERRKELGRAEGALQDAAEREIERERGDKPKRRRIARPERIQTAARRLGGISWASWRHDYPGETRAEYRRALPGVFRSQRGGGMSWEHLATALEQEGYGPAAPSADKSWLVDALADAAAGDEVLPSTAGEYVARREERERWKQYQAQRRDEREQARAQKAAAKKPRKRNPQLLIVGNPTPTALAAFRRFHAAEPSGVRRIPGNRDLVALGDVVEIVYRPRTGVRTDADYVHKFKPGAVLASSADGRDLVVLPNPRKPFRVDWDRGIIG